MKKSGKTEKSNNYRIWLNFPFFLRGGGCPAIKVKTWLFQHVWYGYIGVKIWQRCCHLRFCDTSNTNLRSGDRSAADETHAFVMWQGRGVVIHRLFKRMREHRVYHKHHILSPYKKTFANRLQITHDNNYLRLICHMGRGVGSQICPLATFFWEWGSRVGDKEEEG